jgi:hypothetical protein
MWLRWAARSPGASLAVCPGVVLVSHPCGGEGAATFKPFCDSAALGTPTANRPGNGRVPDRFKYLCRLHRA